MTNSVNDPLPPRDLLGDSTLREITLQLEQLGDWYLDQLQAGQSPHRVQIVAAYRDLADRIQRRLELIELLHSSDSLQ